MKISTLVVVALASIVIPGVGTLSVAPSADGGLSIGIEAAQARVGRPATPASAAGVARRTTRRGAAAVGAATVGAAGAAAAGAAAARPRCGYSPYPPCR